MDPLLIIVALVSAILFLYCGYVLGNYFPIIKRDKNQNRVQESGSRINSIKERFAGLGEKKSKEETAQPAREATSPRRQSGPRLKNPEDSIQVWHDRISRQLFAQIEGQIIDMDQPLDARQHSRLSLLMIDLQEKVGLGSGLSRSVAERVDKAEESIKHPSYNPIKSFINYVKADVPKLEDQEDTIAEKINKILQEQMKGTILVGKGISMGEWPGRGVVFMVGLDVYDEINDIPNPDIRTAIRNAARTWEASQENKE